MNGIWFLIGVFVGGGLGVAVTWAIMWRVMKSMIERETKEAYYGGYRVGLVAAGLVKGAKILKEFIDRSRNGQGPEAH